MSQEKFLQTLKTLGFPDVHKYSASDFDSAFSNPELKDFLNYFCELDEENVLTEEELKEYASITPNELINLENLIEEEKLQQSENLDECKEEFLKECLTQQEKHNDILLEQKSLLIEHQTVLSDEKAECEKAHFNLKKMYDDYMMNKIPQVQDKLSSTLNAVFELIFEMQDQVKIMQENDCILPELNLKDIKDYFAEEEKIITLVSNYLQNNFQFKDEKHSVLNTPGLTNEEIVNEIQILKKSFKKAKILEIQTASDYKKRLTAQKFFKDYEDDALAQSFDISNTLLSVRLNEEIKKNENLQKKEKLLMSYISNKIDELLEAKCSEIAIARSNEVVQDYEQALEAISFPLTQMLNQRARLHLFLLYINVYHQHLLDMQALIDQVSEFLDSEQKFCVERKEQNEILNEIQEDEYLSEDSIFLSAYKILKEHNTQLLNKVTLADVLVEIEQLNKVDDALKEQNEHKNNVIRILENRYSSTEKNFLHGNEFSRFLTLEDNFSKQINQLSVLFAEIHKIYTETESLWDHKNKLLDTKRNLNLSRSFFILALLQKNMFFNICETIKKKKHAMDFEKEKNAI